MRSKHLLSLCLLLSTSHLLYAAVPTITSFSPASGSVGTVVTITGTGYSGTSIKIGGKPAIVISAASTKIVAMVMPGAVTGTLTATNTSGTATSATNFTVTTNTAYPTNIYGNPLSATGATTGQLSDTYSVALSADGKTAAVGESQDQSATGATWVFVNNGSNWVQQSGKLIGTGAPTGAYQGYSLALSADGNTLIEGGQGDVPGAAWIFTRTGNTWSQQAKLVGTGGIGVLAQQGYSVSISADGNTALSVGINDNNGIGAGWIFTRTGTTWTQAAKLTPTGCIGAPGVGVAAALSADGTTALIGGNLDNGNVGASWVFVRSGNTWIQQAKIIGTGYTGKSNQGTAVALSADGNTALIGGANDNSLYGAAWVFTRNGATWSQQGGKITPSTEGSTMKTASFGLAASLTADGKTALIAGPDGSEAWIFTLTGGKWVQQGNQIAITLPSYPTSYGGSGTSITPDGLTAAFGGVTTNTRTGLFYLFSVNVPAVITYAQPAPVTYGATDFTPAAISTNTTSALTYSSRNPKVATIVNNKIHIVGAGTDTIIVSQAAAGHFYAAVPVARVLTVNKAPLKIVADNQIKDYNFNNPELTCHYVGFVNGDTTNALSYLPTLTTTTTKTSPAGTYPIKLGPAAAANYTFTYYAGTLTVYNCPAVTYGAADFDPKPGYTGVSYTSSDPAVATIVNGKVHITGAGITTISGKLGTTTGSSGLFVNKDSLFIRANNVVKVQGTANPALTATYQGFVYGQTVANLTSRPMITTNATTASPQGIYQINISGGTSPNYVLVRLPAELSVILKSASTNKIYTIAGNGKQGSSGDGGVATAASLNQPLVMVKDSKGNIFVACTGDNKIRRIDAKTKVITTFAGTGTAGFSGDGGPATKAKFNFLTGVGLGVDVSGNIYVSDASNNRVRVITATTNIVTTIAGTGVAGFSGDGGQASAAQLSEPQGIGIDASHNIYISDGANNRIRRIDGVTKVISTVAGGGTSTPFAKGSVSARSLNIGFNEHIALDYSGNLYYSDEGYDCIVKVDKATNYITLLAGTGTFGYSGDGGPATAAQLQDPNGLAIDSVGNVYVTDEVNQAIRRIDAVTHMITTVAGTGLTGYTGDGGLATLASLNYPTDLCLDKSEGIYMIDYYNNVIRKVGSSNVIANNAIPLQLTQINLTEPSVNKALSPNGDGRNDVLTINNIEKYPDNELTLINTAGKVIYHTIGYDNQSKVFSGQQRAGTYFYQLRYKDGDTIKNKTGYFVIRY